MERLAVAQSGTKPTDWLHNSRSLAIPIPRTQRRGFLPLPSAHAVRHTFVEVGWAHGSLYPAEPHPVPHRVAHTGEGEGDALALELLDGVRQRVAGGGVNEVHRIPV